MSGYKEKERERIKKILKCLATIGEASIYKISRELKNVNRISLMRLLSRMEKEQLVKCKAGKRKAKLYSLTLKGVSHAYNNGLISKQNLYNVIERNKAKFESNDEKLNDNIQMLWQLLQQSKENLNFILHEVFEKSDSQELYSYKFFFKTLKRLGLDFQTFISEAFKGLQIQIVEED